MKIGTCVGLDSVEGLEQKLKTLREHDMEVCQLIAWEPSVWTKENAYKVKDLLEKYQIKVSAFWCGWEGPLVWDLFLRIRMIRISIRSAWLYGQWQSI